MAERPDVIQYEDFAKLDLRVGTIKTAEDHPNADKLIVLQVDLGDEQRQILAGLRGHYQAADMVGKQIVIVANLAPRMMRGLESQGMLLAASDQGGSAFVLVSPERPVEPGGNVS